jgi:hypothetical protein
MKVTGLLHIQTDSQDDCLLQYLEVEHSIRIESPERAIGDVVKLVIHHHASCWKIQDRII